MSNTFQPKMRGHMPQKRFADQAKAAKAASTRSNFKRPDGMFDRLVLGEKPIWVRFAPEQSYHQEVYDRESKSVIEVDRPWFEHGTHFVPSRKRSMICSSGPRRDQPCRGCAIRAQFYDVLREQEKSTQVRNEEKRKSPPVQAAVRYGMAATCLEKIFHLAATDAKGKVKTNKQGQPIMNYIPAPLSGLPLLQQKSTDGTIGHNFHWSFGSFHLAQLADIDQTLWNHCANCANDLMATQFTCTECNAVVYGDTNGVVGSDLRSVRETNMKCPVCQHEGPTSPILSCTGCETPAEGNLLAFDLQLRVVPIDDKKSDVKMEKFRLPDYVSLFSSADAERITELVYSPLDIPGIFAPESVDVQAWALSEELKGVGIDYHLKAKNSKPYGTEDVPADDGDPDQMHFDNSAS